MGEDLPPVLADVNLEVFNPLLDLPIHEEAEEPQTEMAKCPDNSEDDCH
mgnify:CR=1 FL=1